MKGRKPLPHNLKIIRGKVKKTICPQPAATIPDCPPHLDTEAQAEWHRIVPELFALGLLTACDRAALAVYCQSWSRWTAAELAMRERGPVVKSPNGYPILSPFLSVANGAAETMRKYLVEFGLSPSSRTRIGPSNVKPADAFEEFLEEQKA